MTKAIRAALAVAAITLAAAPAAHAHRQWIAPSATVLSGAEPYVTFDGAVSNTLFYPDHVPMRLEGLKAIGPDGEPVQVENASTGKYRSTFDVKLTKPGTYKVVNASDMLTASYKLGGETKRWRGSAEQLATAIPKEATEVQVAANTRRIETFVTAGAPNTTALKPTGKGLELEPITHPNDLVVGEKAQFKLLLNGQPAKDAEVEVVLGGARYRAKAPEMKVKTNAQGVFEVSWPEAGMYWVESTVRGTDAQGRTLNSGYVATLEVMPE